MAGVADSDILQVILKDWPALHLGGTQHWNSLPETLAAIDASVKPGDSTIETGVGVSTVVFASRGANHTVVSPSAEEHERVRAYCRRIGVDDSRLNFIAGSSDEVLPSFLGAERILDGAFIDGAHSFPFPIIDWHYISRALKIGGTLLMDDIPIPAAAQVFRHMRLEPNWQLDGVYDGRSASFTLLAPPPPGDDWSDQPYNGHYPDFSFAPVPDRIRLEASYRAKWLRSGLAQRYPSLSALRRRIFP